jgi:hypothetical protein
MITEDIASAVESAQDPKALCQFFNSRDTNKNFDDWPTQRSVKIKMEISVDKEFAIYFPVYNIIGGIPKSIVVTGATAINPVSSVYRLFGSAFGLEDFTTGRSLYSDYKTNNTPTKTFTGADDLFEFLSNVNLIIKNAT